ncbi:hypothetical protein GcC1_119036, partial [Golovinomyces cichoracearum]
FEAEWFKLLKLTKDSSDTYRQQFAVFLGYDKAKRDSLLGLISRHHKIIVDNLTTKDSLTFTEVKQRLLDCDYESSGTALLTVSSNINAGNRKSNKRGRKPEKIPDPEEPCTFCKKHFLDKPRNHSWETCPQRKQWSKRSNKSDPPTFHEAHMTTEIEQVSPKNFYLDTSATSHMCPYPEKFINLKICSGLVKTSSGDGTNIKGKRSVIINCIINNELCTYKLNDVLYVPEIKLPLFSWRVERLKGLKMNDDANIINIYKDNKICLQAKFVESLPVIMEEKYPQFQTLRALHMISGMRHFATMHHHHCLKPRHSFRINL